VIASGAPDLVDLARRRGWEIAPANDEDGVAQVVERLLENQARIEAPGGQEPAQMLRQ
jgi:hypothetical protein